jgi:tetratricopeptide (TPR) repeat protein
MRASLSICAAVALLAAPHVAQAEDADNTNVSSGTVAAKPLERARVRYREGVQAYKEGHFRDAIDLFLEADQLAPSAALSFNIGAAYEKLGEPAAALRWYRDYLRRAPDASDRSQVEALVSGFEHTLESSGVQQITVTSTPEGAELAVDGQSVGTTPCTFELSPGSHTLALTLAGRAPASRSVDLPADHAIDVTVELAEAIPEAKDETQSASPVPIAVTPAVTAPHDAHSNDGKLLTTFGWVGVAAGGAALGGALVFEFLRQSAESDAKSDHTQIGYADKLDTMYGRQTAARVLLGVGAGLAATGGVLLWLGRSRGPAAAQTAISVTCGPGGCGSSLHGRF